MRLLKSQQSKETTITHNFVKGYDILGNTTAFLGEKDISQNIKTFFRKTHRRKGKGYSCLRLDNKSGDVISCFGNAP